MTLGDDLFSLCSFRFRGGSTTTKAHLTCDCELVSQDEGVVMYAHQDLLSIRSKVFKTMINEKQGLPVRLVIPCSVANLQTIGQFLYTDTIKLYSATQESLDELHSTAKLLELYKLVQFVDGLIPNNRSKLVTMPISSLERDLLQLLDNKELTNTVILWNEDDRPPIYASRTILSARSPYFEKIFNGQWCEPDRDSDNKWVIIMPTEIIHQTMRDIVHLMYHNKLPTIDLDRISELMQWSGFFVMDNMFDLCQLTLMRCINVENVCTLWRFADDIDAEELGQKCLKFFINHYSDVSRTEGFVTLKKTLLHSALISGHISFPRQLLIMDLEKWAKYQLETDFASRPGPMPLPSSQDFYNLLQDLLPPNTLFNLENRNRVLNHRPII